MIDWLTTSVAEHSPLWLVLSSSIGGVIGASVTFFFQDYLRYKLSMHRAQRKIYLRYQNPLLGAANSLERQINTIVRNRGESWLNDEYYRLSTFYKFGIFLFFIRNIEEEVGFLDMYSSRRAKEFTRRLYAPFSGLSSVRRYDLDEEGALPRDIARAIGEEMQPDQPGSTQTNGPIGFASFVRKYGRDRQFQNWFASIDDLLKATASNPGPAQLERLIVTGAHLKMLMRSDPSGTYTRGGIANLDLIEREVPANTAGSGRHN